jgi:hypothetical protein
MVPWLGGLGRWFGRIWLPLSWGGKLREVVIDLTRVSSRDDFQREMSRHFSIAADHTYLWRSIYEALSRPAGPLRLRLLGWEGFKDRMPRYAKRLERMLVFHQKWGRLGGVQLITIEYG